MNKDNQNKNLADRIIMGIYIVNMITITLGVFIDVSAIFLFINIIILFSMVYVLEPLNKYIKKGILKNKAIILAISSRMILMLIFAISLYKILLSNNYNLKYTYFICLVSFILLIISKMAEGLINDYSRRKIEGKKYNIIFLIVSIFLGIMILTIIVYFITRSYSYPSRRIVLDDVKIPEYISVYKYDYESGKTSIGISEKNKIDSFEDLNKIMSELNSIEIESVTSTDLLNYYRKISNQDPYYVLIPSYKDVSFKENTLEDGYIDIISIRSDGDMVIESIKLKDNRILGNRYYKEVYPINLSQETKDILSKYK